MHCAYFPIICPTFQNPLDSKDKICFEFKNQPFEEEAGCYLWTHKSLNKQYIGSSRNLGLRLAEYFRDGYLKLQSKRGSVICRAIKKHGHNEFSLSIMVLGASPEQDTVYSSKNLPDFVVMEQSYLDNYIMDYNVNRVASSGYEPPQASVNVGTDKPSYGLKGDKAFVWNNNHSIQQKERWSKARGKYTCVLASQEQYVYYTKTFDLIQSFFSIRQLSTFLNIKVSFGEQIAKLIKSSEFQAITYKDFIISFTPHSAEVLSASWDLFPVKKDSRILRGSRNIIIYGFNPSTNEYKSPPSGGEILKLNAD